jgi:hypothetical protein
MDISYHNTTQSHYAENLNLILSTHVTSSFLGSCIFQQNFVPKFPQCMFFPQTETKFITHTKFMVFMFQLNTLCINCMELNLKTKTDATFRQSA